MDNEKLNAKIAAILRDQTQTMAEYIDGRISESEQRMALIIENDV